MRLEGRDGRKTRNGMVAAVNAGRNCTGTGNGARGPEQTELTGWALDCSHVIVVLSPGLQFPTDTSLSLFQTQTTMILTTKTPQMSRRARERVSIASPGIPQPIRGSLIVYILSPFSFIHSKENF